MFSFGFVACEPLSGDRIGVRFHQIGPYEDFMSLIGEFKLNFRERYWEDDRWIIPVVQMPKLQAFCIQRGLRVKWQERRAQQLRLI